MPLSEDVEEYFKREVLPHAPDAWIDHEKTKVGYEIPFNRHFYVFKPPRPLAEIDADLKASDRPHLADDRGADRIELSAVSRVQGEWRPSGLRRCAERTGPFNQLVGCSCRSDDQIASRRMSSCPRHEVWRRILERRVMELEDRRSALTLSGMDGFKHLLWTGDFV